MTTTMHDINEPLTYANAPRYERDGRTFVEHESVMELARRIAAEDASLLRRLADK